jgi:hypothetical protein
MMPPRQEMFPQETAIWVPRGGECEILEETGEGKSGNLENWQ